MWYVFGLIWIALIAGIVWSYRRKKAQRDAERARQLDVLYSDLKLKRGAAAVAPAAFAPAAAMPVIAAPAASLASVTAYSRRPRLLSQPDTLLYFVFRIGLPDHEIFPNVPLGDVLEVTDSLRGYEREQQTRRLAQFRLDLIVCTKPLDVIAAVIVSRDEIRDAVQAENTRFTEQCLQAAGIRLIRIDRAALPRHHQVRELVYGPGAWAKPP